MKKPTFDGQAVAKKRRRKRQQVFNRYGGCCAYCGVDIAKPGKFTLDHLQPRSRGGDNSIGNLRPSCWTCNQSKADRTPAEWAADIMRVCEKESRFSLLGSKLVKPALTTAAAIVAALLFWR